MLTYIGGIIGFIHYLDDFLISALDSHTCHSFMQSFSRLGASLGIPIADNKTCGPAQQLVYLGIEVDTVRQVIRLSDDRLANLIAMLKGWVDKKKCTKRELLSLIGTLSFACKVVKPGRIFLRRIIDLSCTVNRPSHHISLNIEARADIQWWITFAPAWNGQAMMQSPDIVTSTSLELFTDASGLGIGAVYGRRWLSSSWPPEISSAITDINTRELVAIAAAVLAWGNHWADRQILIHTNNLNIVHIWTKGTSPNKEIMKLVRGVFLFCARTNINLLFQHIPGHINKRADLLSRLQVAAFKRLHPTSDPIPTEVPAETWALLT